MTPAELLMTTVLKAWGEADIGPALEALDENVIWKSASSCEGGMFRFGGTYRGKANVVALLSTLSANYFFRQYSAKEVMSKGEVVWGLFDVQGSYLPSGASGSERRQINLETAFRWRIRDGKILEAQSFFDTAALLVQQHELRTNAA
jgi:hypothetical protein